jgi:hypothetical protein
LSSWNRSAKRGGPKYVPPAERIAVFDNDGTLWCEKPMPVELGFILKRLDEMAEQDSSLRDRQPWKAAHDKDYARLGDVITKHYHGDDTDVKVLMGGMLRAFAWPYAMCQAWNRSTSRRKSSVMPLLGSGSGGGCRGS